MKRASLFALLIVVLLSGCGVKSISNSGYNPGGYAGRGGDNPFHKGELSEFDVLGIDAGKEVSEADIAVAVSGQKERPSLRKGDSILLIQSGAMIPDQDMTDNMEKYFSVNPFTGVPEQNKATNTSYAKSLRLAAARAGIGTIIVYRGVLESGTTNLATKTVSWVPIVGWATPDSSQDIRIRLKVAVIDVKSGRWEVFVPRVFEDPSYSAILNRESSDQAQVALLKAQGYKGAVDATLARYVR